MEIFSIAYFPRNKEKKEKPDLFKHIENSPF